MRTIRLALLLSGLGLTGCVALSSHVEDVNGVIYHLPKSLLTVTVQRYTDTTNGRIWYDMGMTSDADAQNGTIPDPGGANKLALIPGQVIPDPEHRYTLKYNPSALSDDRLCIARSTTGLLTDVQFVADDRTPQIAFNIARFIAGTLPQPTPTGFTEREIKETEKLQVSRYVGQVDPFDKQSVDTFNSSMNRFFGSDAPALPIEKKGTSRWDNEVLKIDFARMKHLIRGSASTWPEGCSLENGCPQDAWQERCEEDQICYRTRLTLPVDLTVNGATVDSGYADIINAWDIGSISVERAFLVQKLVGLRFQQGALAAAVIRKPSEVEELTLLPLNIVYAVLSVPSGLFAQAFGTTGDDNAQILTKLNDLETKVEAAKDTDELILEGASALQTTNENITLSCNVSGNPIFGWQSGTGPGG